MPAILPLLLAGAMLVAVTRPAEAAGYRSAAQHITLDDLNGLQGHGHRRVVCRGDVNVIETEHDVRRGETLGSILSRRGLGPGEIDRWARAARGVYDLARLHPGHRLVLCVDHGARKLLGLEYQIKTGRVLVAEEVSGEVRAWVEGIPTEVRLRGVAVRIEDNLYTAVRKVGVPDRTISDIAEIFGWKVDFHREVRRGDRFRVVYEEIYQPGRVGPVPGRVLGAELVVGGDRRLTATYFDDGESGTEGYYDSEARPFSRPFLRYPIEFTHISSVYSGSRLHPILRVRRPHRAVDLAAPRGTPVRAIAGGRVTHAGWKGRTGRFVKIDHGGSVASGYGHLHRIARGVRAGAAVRKGQVVGTVGSTGLATGPHLHYVLYLQGRAINPLRADLPAGAPLTGTAKRAFLRVRGEIGRYLTMLSTAAHPFVASWRVKEDSLLARRGRHHPLGEPAN